MQLLAKLDNRYTTENRKTTHETLTRLLREYPKLVWCPRAAWTNGRYKEPAYRLSSEPGSDCLPVKNNFTKQISISSDCFFGGSSISIDHTLNLFLSADLLLITNSSSLMITVENRETKHTYRVRYIPVDLLWSVQDANIYYGLGLQALNKRHHLTRDLHIDVQKGLALYGPKRSSITVKPTDLCIPAVSFLGVGFFHSLSLSTYDHMANFYDVVE
uniref:D-glucuronyl C5-epimerase beta-sandwich domain-containing protein n=1 Tax=Glossina palpalis gambiensis TaxID=67801 RepID=A0A1B0BHG7_9MUSC